MTVDLKINKSDWNKAKLGDLVEEVNDRVANPSESEFDRFVGLGDFVSGDLKIKSWSSTESLSSSAKAFKKGDILFARRNAYLRRASMVDFEGCCSGDAFVLREKKDKVVPGFLAFIVNSNDLWNYANSNAAGTMSKRVKWRDLAKYEFLLPPLDQQKQLAQLLWAMDEVIEKEKEVREKLIGYYQAFIDNYFTKKNVNWKEKQVSEVASINNKSLGSNTDPDYEFKYLDLSSIVGPNQICDLEIIKYKDAPSRAKRMVNDKSIIISLVRPYQQANVLIQEGNNIIASTGTAVVDLHKTEDSEFVFHQFFSKKFIRYSENRMTGTSYPAITHTDIRKYKLLFPEDASKIVKISNQLSEINETKKLIDSKIHSSEQLLRSLIHQIF